MDVVSCREGIAERVLALTFDDGPGAVTAPILDLLGRHGARATFFVLGARIAGRERVLRRTLGDGHELGNHTWSHAHPAELTEEQLRAELARTSERIAEVTGLAPRFARPPYGEDAERVARVAGERGLRTVLWSVDPVDWAEPPAAEIVERTLAGVQAGAIVDLHDGFSPRRRDASRQATVAALAELLPTLTGRGYRSVTVSELLGTE